MIKDIYLKCFDTEDLPMFAISKKTCISFLKRLNDDDIKKIGNSIFWIFPSKIFEQKANIRKKEIDYSFVDTFRKDYNIPDKYTTQDKVRGGLLGRLLEKNPDLTVEEFFRIAKI